MNLLKELNMMSVKEVIEEAQEFFEKNLIEIKKVHNGRDVTIVNGVSYGAFEYDTTLYIEKKAIISKCSCGASTDEVACIHACALVMEYNDFLEEKDLEKKINHEKGMLFKKIGKVASEIMYNNLSINNSFLKQTSELGLYVDGSIDNPTIKLALLSGDNVEVIDSLANFNNSVYNCLPYESKNGKLYVNKESFAQSSLDLLDNFLKIRKELYSQYSYYSYFYEYLKLDSKVLDWLFDLEDIKIIFNKDIKFSQPLTLKKNLKPIYDYVLDKDNFQVFLQKEVEVIKLDNLIIIINDDNAFIADSDVKKCLKFVNEMSNYTFELSSDFQDLLDTYLVLRHFNLIDEITFFEINNSKYTYELKVFSKDSKLMVYLNFIYENKTINLLEQNDSKISLALQSMPITLLQDFGFIQESNYLYIEDHYLITVFFEYLIKNLSNDFDVIIDKSVNNLYIEDPAKDLGIKVSIVDDLIQMELELGSFSIDELKAIYVASENMERYFITDEGRIINLKDTKLNNNFKTLRNMNIDLDHLKDNKICLPKYYSLFIDNHSFDLKADKDETFNNLTKEIEIVKDKKYLLPQLNVDLRLYQKEGFRWLLSNYDLNFGSILADDMGLGKTVQIITFLSYIYQNKNLKRSIIIVPKTLLYNWEHEFFKFSPQLNIQLVEGTKKCREDKILNTDSNIIITTYDLFKRDLLVYQKEIFECVIIDEAQAIKNPTTSISRNVKKINSNHMIALSGTPIENNLIELWSIFEYILPGYLNTKKQFKQIYENPILRGDSSQMKELLKLINPFILRRTKKEVLNDLPDKIEKNIYCEMSKEQIKIYQSYFLEIREEFETNFQDNLSSSRIKILALLTKLRQICCHPYLIDKSYEKTSGKLEMLTEIVEESIENNKILVFSQFTSMLDIIRKQFDNSGVEYLYLDGKVTSKKRMELCDQFNNDDKVKVFLISLKAGGSGLNLTGANIVIHYDQWWNPAVMNQASDRAHRIGQKNTVQIINLVTRKTIEEKIMEIQDKKKDLISQILETNNISLSNLNDEELRKLFEI